MRRRDRAWLAAFAAGSALVIGAATLGGHSGKSTAAMAGGVALIAIGFVLRAIGSRPVLVEGDVLALDLRVAEAAAAAKKAAAKADRNERHLARLLGAVNTRASEERRAG
ncbi:MAG TPA: hypothetical protein VGW74_08055 [Propionibacteriaceae bacterium]|nr:hypothetical protein [Propionibacteriaceae bacterium]